MMLGTMLFPTPERPRRPSQTYDCPFCGAVVVVRSHDDGGAGMTCRCCGWWRVERPDGASLEENEQYLRERHAT